MSTDWHASLSNARRGIRPIYALIDRQVFNDMESVVHAVQVIFGRASDASLVRDQVEIKIKIEREVTLAEVVATLATVKNSVKIIKEARCVQETTIKSASDAGLPLLVAVEEVAETLSSTWLNVSNAQVMDVIARLVVAEEGVQVKQLARKSVVKLLNGEEAEGQFEDEVARYNYLVAQESLSPEENNEADAIKARLTRYPDVHEDSKLRLMIDDATWRRLLFGGGEAR